MHQPCSYTPAILPSGMQSGHHTDEHGTRHEVSANDAAIENQADTIARSREELAEAASGLLSFRQLARREDPFGLMRGNATAFNLKINPDVRILTDLNQKTVPSMVSRADAISLGEVYFQTVNQVFGVVRAAEFRKQLELEFDEQETGFVEAAMTLTSYRPVIFGVLALGSLFSRHSDDPQLASIKGRNELECACLDYAQAQLENSELSTFSNLDDLATHQVTGQILRFLYLRATASPPTAWLVCCKAMHTAEMVNLHDESKWEARDQDKNHLRHVFWALEVLNTWISLEVGRSKVHLTYIRCQFPKQTNANDFTPALVELYLRTKDVFSLGECGIDRVLDALKHVIDFKPPHMELSLDRSYSAIIIFRRMRLAHIGEQTIKDLVDVSCDALQECERLAQAGQPWWHVINVPFQLLAMIIMIDRSECCSRVTEILHTMTVIAREFNTEESLNVLKMAKSLLQLFGQRKESEAAAIYANISAIDVPPSARVETEMSPGANENDILSFALDSIINGGFTFQQAPYWTHIP